MSSIIKVENLSKRYTIYQQKQERYVALRDVIMNKLLETSKRILFRTPLRDQRDRNCEDFWALKDINFEINQGDRVGIIGRNGAGKSTLLKILSRITVPTTGRITIRGRIASLLEVGTGFHPELTGRENIFLNGAILGMRNIEILRKFDEIVDFAEIEKFLDTPVKRYSSGMYMKLAFSVAAHLEPEILLIDEVLAVGDIEFQNKCLDEMRKVSKEGRTILFVSHNLALVKSLCNRTILLNKSKIQLDSSTKAAINEYLNSYQNMASTISWENEINVSSAFVSFRKAYIQNCQFEIISSISTDCDFYITIEYEVTQSAKQLRIGFMLQNDQGVLICGSNDPMAWKKEYRDTGIYKSSCRFPKNILSEGMYYICFGADKFPYDTPLIKTDFCISFKVDDVYRHGNNKELLPGIIKPNLLWHVHKLNIRNSNNNDQEQLCK